MADNEFTLPMDYEPTEDISVNAVQATEDPGKFLQEGSGPAVVETSLDKVSDAGTASQDWLVESFAQAATGTFNAPDLWKNREPTTVEEIGRSLVHGFAGSVKSTLSGLVKTGAYAEAAMEDAEHGLAELIVGRSFPNRNLGRALIHSMNEKERSEAWERTLYENRQGIKSDAWYNMLSSAFGSSAALFGAAVAGVPAKTLSDAEGLMIGASYFSEQSSKLESAGESGAKALPFAVFIGTLGGLIAKTGGEAIISDAVKNKFGPAAVSFARGATDNLAKRISKRLLNPVAKKAAKAEAIEELAQEASTIGTEKIQDAVLGTQVNQSTWQEDTQRMLVGLGGGAAVGGLVGEYVYNKNLNKLQKKLEPVFEGNKNKAFEAASAIADAVLNEAVAENAAVKSLEGHVADLNPELAQVLSHVFEDLVNQGFVEFRQATPDEVRQAGLDWANLMSATAILDAMERNIPLRTHPLFNAIAEIDRILLEGRDPNTGDLLPLDINNAQVRELANQIEDYIEQNRETRQAEEASKLAALREADMRARQETIQELERAAIAELEKEQAANNQERITELQQQITELQHQMDLLREEQGKYAQERAAQGRVSIKQARAQETKRIAHTKTQNAIGSFNSFEAQVVMPMAIEAVNSGQVALPQDPTGVGYDASDFASAVSDEVSDLRGESVGERYFKKDDPLRQVAREWLASDERAKANFDKAKQLAKTIADAEKAETEQAAEIPDDMLYQDLAAENARLDDMYPAYTGETINIDGKERTVYNSNGERIAQSEPALRNFWNWFGDSKVVDDQGRPLVVYHGTLAGVKEFKKKKIRRGNIFGKGFYFTNSKQGAELYSSGKTLSVYLSFQKPFVVWEQEFDFADGEAVVNAITEYGYTVSDTNREEILESESPLYTAKINYGESTLNAISNILARENGYDSLIGMTSIREFVAFEPNQIKSTENTGEFGIGVNNMYHQDQPQAKLIATHNMSKEGLERALDLGGLVMPSMAITKFTDGPFTGYGDISFIGDAILANPTRTTDAYDRDAWTPMVNNIVHQFTEGGVERLKALVEEAKQKNPRDTNSYSVYRMNIEKGMSDDPRSNTMAVELFSILHDIPREQARQNITYNWGEEKTEMHKQYLEWYNDKLLAETKAFIYEGYTPSGKIRLKPLTLDNLVAALKKQDRFGRMTGDFFTPSDIIKMNLVRFKNVGEIRDAQGRLVSRDEAHEAYKEIGSDFYNLASELNKHNVKENDYTSSDQRLAWALILEKGTLEERLAKQNLKNDAESVKKVKKFIKDVKNIKVPYFEVKPRRAVKFYEFSGVILPKGESYDNLAARLEEEGVLNIYRATTPEEKTAALKDLTEKRPWTLLQNKKTSKSTTGLGTEHRGGYDPMTKAIIFNKTSDLTTLFHESAHYWFDRNLRYYRTGLASPEWKKKWEDVMNELGATPNARGTIPVSAIRSASEKFARSMEAYLREGKYESAAIQWAHQDYANMVKRVYRNIWSTYWGLDDLSPAVKQWFDMFGLKTDDATTAFAEEDKIETDEQMVGAVVAEDATKPDVDAETKTIVADAGAQVVENPATQEIAVVPADPFETGKKARSKLPRSAEAATGVSMDDIIYNRRSMSDAFKAAQQLVNTDPVRAWEILKGGQEMVDGLYAGDIYRALVAKYQAENNPMMLKNVVQAFAGAARRAGRSVKAFDLESPRISFEKTINSLDKIFDTKKNDKRIEKVKNELKEFLHDPSALRVGWEEFKNIVGCK